MYCILESSDFERNVIGPFTTLVEALEFNEKKYTPKKGCSAVIVKCLIPMTLMRMETGHDIQSKRRKKHTDF